MVGAAQAVGARPAPLRMLPAVQTPDSKAVVTPFRPAVVGVGNTVPTTAASDSLALSQTAQAKVFKPAVQGVSSEVKAGGSASRFSPGTIGQGLGEVADVGFLGNLLVMGYSAIKGGAAAAPGVSSLWTALKSFDLDGLWGAGKSLGQTGLGFAGKSAGFAGALSLLVNGMRVVNNQISISVAGARVVGDSVAGAAGGFGGAIAGGVGLTLLGALGIAGAPLTIGAAIIGMIGYHYGDKMARQTGVHRWLVQNTYDMIRGMTGRP